MDLQLKGKTAVVAAASKGLGRAIAEQLAAEGANLYLCSRDEQSIRDVAQSLAEKYGVRAEGTAVDLSRAEDIRRWIDSIAQSTDRIDALVCNAGGPPGGAFLSFDDAAWEAAFQSNVMSVVRLIRGCYPYMKTHGARVVTIASSSVKVPLSGMVLSNTMRPGVAGLMKTLSIELAADGILLNTVCPGRILTDRLLEYHRVRAEQSHSSVEAVQAEDVRDIPLRRFGTPEELAVYAAFLLSPRNTYVTGSVFYIDGGLVKAH